MELKWKLRKVDFVPAAYGSTETKALMDVHRGTWVKGVMVRTGEAFTGTTTCEVGDGGNTAGFVAKANFGAGLRNGTGPYLVAPDAGLGAPANGKLYTEDDTIDIKYTTGDAAAAGICTVYIVYAEIE